MIGSFMCFSQIFILRIETEMAVYAGYTGTGMLGSWEVIHCVFVAIGA